MRDTKDLRDIDLSQLNNPKRYYKESDTNGI